MRSNICEQPSTRSVRPIPQVRELGNTTALGLLEKFPTRAVTSQLVVKNTSSSVKHFTLPFIKRVQGLGSVRCHS
jgi:hypothetical protein